ncbi:hypothetical protein ACFLU5_01735 [Bacteroidota bacterium]
MAVVIIVYIFLCFLVAAKGSSWKDLNFWYTFLISIGWTPFAGWIYVQSAKSRVRFNKKSDDIW